jgi:hypothetical protein
MFILSSRRVYDSYLCKTDLAQDAEIIKWNGDELAWPQIESLINSIDVFKIFTRFRVTAVSDFNNFKR